LEAGLIFARSVGSISDRSEKQRQEGFGFASGKT
jgi:hypothetical protein